MIISVWPRLTVLCWVIGTIVAQQCSDDWTTAAVSAPVHKWFSDAWRTPASLRQLQLQIANSTSPVVIRDVLTPEAMLKVQAALKALPLSRWPRHKPEQHHPPAANLFDISDPAICSNLRNPSGSFQYDHHNIFDATMLTGAAKEFMQFLQGGPAQRFFAGLLQGSTEFSAGVFGASWYMPGDYSTVHDDVTVIHDRTGRGHTRRLALVFHFSDVSFPAVECGGQLVWCNSNRTGVQILPPILNQLVVFAPADSRTEHFVNRVEEKSECRGNDRQRLAINGWYLSAL